MIEFTESLKYLASIGMPAPTIIVIGIFFQLIKANVNFDKRLSIVESIVENKFK